MTHQHDPQPVEEPVEITYADVKAATAQLAEDGLIVDSGLRRKNKDGVNEIVWIPAPDIARSQKKPRS